MSTARSLARDYAKTRTEPGSVAQCGVVSCGAHKQRQQSFVFWTIYRAERENSIRANTAEKTPPVEKKSPDSDSALIFVFFFLHTLLIVSFLISGGGYNKKENQILSVSISGFLLWPLWRHSWPTNPGSKPNMLGGRDVPPHVFLSLFLCF